MKPKDENPQSLDGQALITLGLLNEIADDSCITQRDLAQRLGVALGLANSYLKRCIRKGLIKVKQAPTNRYSYYMTPEGLSEKSRLTAEFLKQSFNFFRVSRKQLGDIFANLSNPDQTPVVLLGKSDLAEVAILSAAEHGVSLALIIDATAAETTSTFMQIPVAATLDALPDGAMVILTDMTKPQELYDEAALILPPERLLYPNFLGIRTTAPFIETEGGAA